MRDPILFAFAVLAILATPGPTNTLIATSGAAAGVRRSLRLVPAELAGYLISILTIGLLLRPVLASRPWLASGLRVLVGAYLLLLAAKLWRYRASGSAALVVGARQVFLTTLLNPKALVFALAIVPFGAPDWPLYLAGFAALMCAVTIAWIGIGAGLGVAAGRRGRGALVPRVGAAVVAGFALSVIAGPYLPRLLD